MVPGCCSGHVAQSWTDNRTVLPGMKVVMIPIGAGQFADVEIQTELGPGESACGVANRPIHAKDRQLVAAVVDHAGGQAGPVDVPLDQPDGLGIQIRADLGDHVGFRRVRRG